MAMNPEIKKQWLEALRSGKYEQGEGQLQYIDRENFRDLTSKINSQSFCCLGVLCDLHSKATDTKWEEKITDANYLGINDVLPDEVKEWAGLSADDPEIEYPTGYTDENEKPVTHKSNISRLNDGYNKADNKQFTFTELADLIEAQL